MCASTIQRACEPIRLTLATAGCLLSAVAFAADYHVDAAKGNDAAPGSANNPFKSLDAAISRAVGGDTIHLHPGKYGPITRAGGVSQHLYTGQHVTIQPVADMTDSRGKVSIEKISLGVRTGSFTGADRKGVFDIYLRVKGVRIIDGVFVYGGRHLEILGCLIERIGPHVGSVANIEKFALNFGAGDDLTAKDCEITNTAGGAVLGGSRNRLINCDIHDITHDGIRAVSSKDSLIEGCRIHNLDDGVDDNDPRGIAPDGEAWNRHCDAIHVFIPGPGVAGTQNSRLTIRNNAMYNCESQAIQFNNYMRAKDMWNEDVLIENNIFGPAQANVVNIADPVDGVIFRHNTYVYFPDGRTFRGQDRNIHCGNHMFRISPECKRAQVYNNILCNTFDSAPNWIAGYNLIVDVKKRCVPTRFDKIVADARFVDAGKFDGRLAVDSPAIDMGTARFADPKIHPTDSHGTARDARPDCGAVELPGRSPATEPSVPTFVPPAHLYLDDFADGNTAVDPWLAGNNQLGLSWEAMEGQAAWHIQAVGDKPGLSIQGTKGPAWMITTNGDDWADVFVRLEFFNAYNTQGAGVLLRANAATEGYLLDIGAGRILKRKKDATGQIVETVLVKRRSLLPRFGSGRCQFTIRKTAKGVRIIADTQGDGRAELDAEDTVDVITAGRVGLYGDSLNGSHRTDITAVKITVER